MAGERIIYTHLINNNKHKIIKLQFNNPVCPDDISIEFAHNNLYITGKETDMYKSFFRCFGLEPFIKDKHISATFKDNNLIITIINERPKNIVPKPNIINIKIT